MKWYHYLILLAALALAFGAGYAWRWYTSPLGCPLCICTARLQPDYLDYWSSFIRMCQKYATVAGVWAGLVIVLLGGILWRLIAGGTGGQTKPTSKG